MEFGMTRHNANTRDVRILPILKCSGPKHDMTLRESFAAGRVNAGFEPSNCLRAHQQFLTISTNNLIHYPTHGGSMMNPDINGPT